jgi:flagellar biosynthesis/type III secretory pathway M-ring protein FliF/YscJ
VIGLAPDRGDQLVVEALPFEATLSPEPPPAAPVRAPDANDNLPPWLRKLLANRIAVIGGAAGGAVLMIAVLFFAMRKRRAPKAVLPAQIEDASKTAIESAERATQQIEAQIAEQAAIKKQQEIEAIRALKLPQVTTKKSEVLTKHIAEEAKKDATSMVQVLRNWINEVEPKR